MPDQAHTFHPASDSLDDRVNALRSALGQLAQARQSLLNADERLGDEKEKKAALGIFENSVNQAIESFTSEELSSVKDGQAISYEERAELVAAQRLATMKNQRKDSSTTDHSLKR